MVKKGMARPDWTHTQPRNDVPPVPELQGKAKSGKERAKPIIAPAPGPNMKVYHKLKGDGSVGDPKPCPLPPLFRGGRFSRSPLPPDKRQQRRAS